MNPSHLIISNSFSRTPCTHDIRSITARTLRWDKWHSNAQITFTNGVTKKRETMSNQPMLHPFLSHVFPRIPTHKDRIQEYIEEYHSINGHLDSLQLPRQRHIDSLQHRPQFRKIDMRIIILLPEPTSILNNYCITFTTNTPHLANCSHHTTQLCHQISEHPIACKQDL